VPLIRGEEAGFVEEAYAETMPCGWQALDGDRRMIWCIRRPPWKLIRYSDPPSPVRQELFDITRDPGERHDLAGQQPEIVSQLSSRLDAWIDG
jgi:hypothetical protein